jgi:hypothetical protein
LKSQYINLYNFQAYVEVESEDDVDAALKHDNALMGQRYIESKIDIALHTSVYNFFINFTSLPRYTRTNGQKFRTIRNFKQLV